MTNNDSSGLDALKNDGVLALNAADSPAREKTVIVLGTARGGTTMVAAVLQALGVYMGEKLGPVLEDVVLSEAVESRDSARVKEIAARRNAEHAIWGWKRPSAVDYNDVWQGCFRNPHIIAVFRDPFAIANRNRISMLSDIFPNMEQSVRHLASLVSLLRAQSCPILLCSYEKALLSPDKFVSAVDDFLGLGASDRWSEAIQGIEPAPMAYLETSRITNSVGHLDRADESGCGGWAFYPRQPARVAKVLVYLNGSLVHTSEARFLRADVKDKGAHPTGQCGFRFAWPVGISPHVGDLVEARVEGDVKPLTGSPRPVQASPQGIAGAETPRRGGALPSFYCIGAQKAGTTWLYSMLKRHPQIHLPKRKELHYWDHHVELSLEWYRQHFEPGFINGDITPAYAILPESKIAEVYALTPDAKLVYSLRHPVDRAWSLVQMVVGRELRNKPLDIGLTTGNPQGETLKFLREKLFHPGVIARSNYAETIRRWTSQFGDDALLWFRYERIAQEPRALLKDICRHVGADPAWADDLANDTLENVVFASEKIPFPPELRAEFAERCTPFIEDLERLLGQRFDAWRT